MNSAVELRAKAQRIAHEARAKLDTIAADGSNAAEVEAEFDRMIGEADSLEGRAKRFEDLEAREASFNAADARRPSEERKLETGSAAERESRAMATFLRTGNDSELRAHSTGTGSEGGFLVPQTWASDIIRSLKAFGPMNDDSVVTYLDTPGGGQFNHPTSNDTANKGSRIAENTQVGAATLVFGTKPLNAYGYTTNAILVPKELVQDSAYDLNAFIQSAAAERMARAINQDMTIGDGSDDPMGLATAALNGKTAASATAIAADELEDLITSVDPAYRGNAAFMFNDSTRSALRKLKDAEGRYVWQPGLQNGDPNTILGYRFHINQDMASTVTGAKSVLFGDFKKYVVRRVKGFELVRLVERYADYNQIGYIGYARYDGDLMDLGAVKALTQA